MKLVHLVAGLALVGAIAGCSSSESDGAGGSGGAGGAGGSTTDGSTTSGTTTSTGDGGGTTTGDGGGTTTGDGGGTTGEGGGTTGQGGGGEGGANVAAIVLPETLDGQGDGETQAVALGELVTELGDPAIPDLVQIEIWDDATPGTQELDSELNQSEAYQRAVLIGVDVEETEEGLVPAQVYVAVSGSFTLGENDIFNGSGDLQLADVALWLSTESGLDETDQLSIDAADITVVPAAE